MPRQKRAGLHAYSNMAHVITVMTLYLSVLAGCSSLQSDPADSAGQRKGEAAVSTEQSRSIQSGERSEAQLLTELTEQSRKDLASRLNMDVAGVTVVEARHVTWPDSSAGCPKPGYMYMQMLTEGALIRLRADNQTYHYHSKGKGTAVFCEKPSRRSPPSRDEARRI
jgi:hypothetical protein